LPEVGENLLTRLWQRGGLPRSFLAASDADSRTWRNDYVQTFLERDVPSLGINIPPLLVRRLWTMLAHNHGQILNVSELSTSLAISDPTVRRYLDVLTGTFMVRQLPPWFENIGKRQIKRPKVFIRDSGLLHALLAVPDHDYLMMHPKLGASWEGFALEQLIAAAKCADDEAYFWCVHQQAELDLMLICNGRRHGFEIKYTDHPALTSSMRAAHEALKLQSLSVVYPLHTEFPLAKGIVAKSLPAAIGELLDLGS
jgi:predicted AAA+ superfamily ATPase